MKKIIFGLIISLPLFIQDTIAQEPKNLPPIEKLVVSDGIMVQIKRGDQFSIVFKTIDIDPGCLINTFENGVLTLKFKGSFSCKGKVVAILTCPTLKEIEVSAKAEVSSENVLPGDSIKLVMMSGGKIYIDFDLKYLSANIKESGLLSSEGYALTQDIHVASSGTFSGYKLEGERVTVKAITGGKAKICVTESMDAEAISKGYISYKCDPKLKKIDAKSGGTIQVYTE